MAESLLLPVVRGVAGKAADALVQSVTDMWGVDDIRGKLERQLLAVQSKLLDAELKSETDPAVKRWMKDLRAVAYEADDVLDDFQYEALRREAQIGESTTRKVLSYFTHHSPLLFRFTVSRNLNNVLKKINDLVLEMNMFGLVEHAEAPQVLYRQTHSALDESSDIFGRDGDKEVVVKLLLDQQDQKNLRVLPIIGMGGLGKTTLAKMVYNDHRVQNHFQLKMWHCVSDNFDACPLVRSIIELVTKERCDLPDTIELLRGRLQEAIGRRRYLLILDDVWNEEQRKWEEDLKPLLSSIGGPGSFIIVTSRSQRVASIMSTLRPHELACLSEDDSWELFSKKAFSSGGEEQAEFVTIGRRIVKKCRGLPLALKTMGGLMSSKQQAQEWEAIEQSNIGDNVRGKDEILSILKLSYRHLSSEMKQCFAFCAIFPKDYEMDKDELIQLWMANGFIQEEGAMDLAQKGESIFHNLVWRSFLQDVKAKTYHSPYRTYESIGCKMHDLMHDLAKAVTDECATIEELIQQKASIKDVRHMRMLIAKLEQNNGVLRGRPSLRTLLGPLTSHKDLEELGLESIRALQCYDSSIIERQVVNAKHLRYLDLSRSGIVSLPNSICMLYNLQSLRLNHCRYLKYLPEDMRTMRKLIHLYLFGCPSLERMPPNISLLNNLRTLTTFIVDTEDGRGIEELKDLRHLANRLELYNLRKIKSVQNAKEANLHQKQNISELLLDWCCERYDMAEDKACNEEAVLESLAPHSKLQSLEVRRYGGLEISQWMRNPRMFGCVRTLIISNCPRCKDLPVAWLSVSLEYLSLRDMGSLTTLCRSIEAEAGGYNNTPLQVFPKLKEMVLDGLSNLERWAENSAGEPTSGLLVFPQLEKLEMASCPKLASVPSSPVLNYLKIRKLGSLTTLCKSIEAEAEGYNNTPLQVFRKLKEMVLDGLPNLERWAENSAGEPSCGLLVFPQLEKLEMDSCPKLASVPGSPVLNYLQIRKCCGLAISSLAHLTTLSKLSYSVQGLYDDDASGGIASMMMPPEDQQNQSQRALENLQELSLFGPNCFVTAPSLSKSHLGLWEFFAFVEDLQISGCDDLVRWPVEELRCLVRLRSLSIWWCANLEGKGSSSEETLSMPQLERLYIHQCDSLLEIPMLPASLEELEVLLCRSLVALPSNLGNLSKLRELKLHDCGGLKALPDGMDDGLASLEELEVGRCPGIEKFPQGLLQRIPTLNSLRIFGCPDLLRRCREGGEYFHLVSSIPRRYIPEAESIQEAESNAKRFFLKWLLPCC